MVTMLKPRIATLDLRRVATMQPGSWRTEGMGGTARGYGYRWQQARERHLRANPLCVMCLDETPERLTPASIVDHKIPHRGDQELFWDETNWQSLCAPHHSSDKQREESANR